MNTKSRFLISLGIVLLFGLVACGPGPLQKEPEKPVPAAPTGLKTNLDKNIDGEIVLSWTKVASHAVGYRVYRDSNKEGEFGQKVYEGKGLTFTDKDVIRDSQYELPFFYVVVAYNSEKKEGPRSEVLTAKSKNFSPPKPPTKMLAKGDNLEKAKIKLSWDVNKETDLMGYYIFRSDADAPIPAVDPVASVSSLVSKAKGDTAFWIDSEVEVGKRYYYTVVAADQGGLLSSNPAALRVNGIVLPSVKPLGPEKGSTGDIPSFSWEALPNAVGYVVVVQTQKFGGKVVWRSKLTAETKIKMDVKPDKLEQGSNYYWFVFAYSKQPKDASTEDGNSVSDIWSFTYQP